MITSAFNVVLLETIMELPCKKLITNSFPDCRILKADKSQGFILQYIRDCGADLVFIDLKTENINILVEYLTIHQIYTVLIGNSLLYDSLNFKNSTPHFYLNHSDPENSLSVMQQICQALVLRQLNQKISRLTNTLSHLQNLTLSISSKDGFEKINIFDILRIEADRSYCTLHYFNSSKILISRPLNALEKRMPEGMFLRIHSAHLVNISAISKYSKLEGHTVLLENGQKLPVAGRRKEHLIEFFKSL